jgi:uridine phosphorylase
MIFASRLTQDFISPETVEEVQQWTGRAVLETLVELKIDDAKLHEEKGSVWERKP